MTDKTYNVLFICTGNSARSIIAEGLLNRMGRGRFKAYSAGSHPSGVVNPFALEELARLGIPNDGFKSKSWEDFAKPGAPQMDFVFTVCDQAAGEMCPVWPGQPMTAHWGMRDPAAVVGTDEAKRIAFKDTAVTMKRRLELMLALPMGRLDELALRREVTAIGKRFDDPFNVLILCTHNSARSVLAEGMLNHWAEKLGKPVRAYSAGSTPSGRINPLAIDVLKGAGVKALTFRSKSWDEFSADGAPPLSAVITVCDSAAAEVCPVFFGGTSLPVKIHWGYPDPSLVKGSETEQRQAFELTRQAIGFRMLQLLALPLAELDRAQLQAALADIAKN